MKCPRCGSEMTIDSHRKIPLEMCYKCGYIEGRNIDDDNTAEYSLRETNFMHIKKLNFNELVAFLSENLDVDFVRVQAFLDDPYGDD